MTQSPRFVCRRRSTRSGITLLEVLVAALLSAILMMGIWNLFTTYSRLFETGQAKTERAQLVRSLMQRLREDLVSAGIDPSQMQQTASASVSDSTTITGSVTSSTTSMADSDPTAAGSQNSFGGGLFHSQSGRFHDSGRVELAEVSDVPDVGLWGTRHTLQLDVMQSVPPTSAEQSSGMSPFSEPGTDHSLEIAPRLPELRTIVYRYFAAGELQTGNQEAPPGLLRRELDWESALSKRTELSMTEVAAFVAGFSTSITENEEAETPPLEVDVVPYDDSMIWIPEIAWLEFRYFDGREWRSEWDSSRQQTLPVAVEVSLVVPDEHSSHRSEAAAEEQSTVDSLSSTDVDLLTDPSELAELPPDEVYRQLIYLPAAIRPDSLFESVGNVRGPAVGINANSYSSRIP